MLELICNAVWLTTGAVLTWRLVIAQQHHSPRRVRVLTVFCLLLVLFPVISLSDDLSTPEAALSDICHGGDGSSGASSDHSGDHTSTVAVALATSAAAIKLHFLQFAETAQNQASHPDTYFFSSDALRAPPVSL
jgi:hypothetical protein